MSSLVPALSWHLRRRFKSTVRLLQPGLSELVGAEAVAPLLDEARAHLAALVPELPPGADGAGIYAEITGTTAAMIAIWKAARDHGLALDDYRRLLDTGMRRELSRGPDLGRKVLQALFFSKVARSWMRRKSGTVMAGFSHDFVEGTSSVDFGFNYRACPIRGIAAAAGTPELAPWICELDRAQSELLGWGLERTQTLSHGASFCDFRFTRGGPTKITPPP